MDTGLVLLGINAALLLILLWRLSRQRVALRALQAQCEQLGAGRRALPPDLQTLLETGPEALISIEILNPMQVAAQQSRFAGAFGSLTPRLVRRIVHERAVGIVRQEVLKHGLEAEVRLHRA